MNVNRIVHVKEREIKNLDNFVENYIKPLEEEEGFSVIDEIKEKINDGRKKIKENIFTIALFGSFSDGKSTVIKAITGEQDIKIAPIPTTDEIEEYNYKDSLKIIDTPGLFSENIAHNEITRKYISEADLTLYLVDAVNPLKKSQHNVVKWLLKDLGKSERLIFVINKMDLVCSDIEDSQAFKNAADIKKDVILKVVESFGIDFKKENIIAIAADPEQEGYDYWKENLDEYNQLSRINTLISKIDEFLENQSKEEFIVATTRSILRDCTDRLFNGLEGYLAFLKESIKLDEDEYNRKQEIFSSLERDVRRAHANIIEHIEEMRKEYIHKLNNINKPKELVEFFEINIGEDFKYFEERINKIKSDEMDGLEETSNQIAISIKKTTESYSKRRSVLLNVGGQLGEKFSKAFKFVPIDKLRDGIVFVRDISKIPYKFKPWEAIKLAKNLKFANSILGPSIEIMSTILGVQKNAEFQEKVEELKSMITEATDIVKSKLDYNEFIENEFTIIAEYHKLSKEENKKINNLNDQYQKLVEINKKLNRYKNKIK